MDFREPRTTGRPVPFGLPKDADTDRLFAVIAGAAADLLAQEHRAATPARVAEPGPDQPHG